MNFNRLQKSGCYYKRNEELKGYTTFKVGGVCDVMCFPKTESELIEAYAAASEENSENGVGTDVVLLGGGSKVLISDEGFHGTVISTLKLNKYKIVGRILTADCGVRLSELVSASLENCFGGLEFLLGIPGTLGGLVAQNGGCFNKSIGDCICFVKSNKGVYNKKDCLFDYRKSRFLSGEIICSVGLRLAFSERDTIDEKIEHYREARLLKQPKGASCGSVFLNDGYFAGKLIDKAGLKGYRIGGAVVSNKHANFIINENGTAKDVYNLIDFIKRTVMARIGVQLVEEVKYIGNF